MIAEIALAVALTITPPIEDEQLPMCEVGEEAVPFEGDYACGPADPALPLPVPSLTAQPAPAEPAPAPSTPAAEPPAAPAPSTPDLQQAPRELAETGPADERLQSLLFGALALIPAGGALLAIAARRGRSSR